MIGLSDSMVPFAKQVLNFVTRPLDDRESESGPEKTSVIDVFWMFCWNLSLTLIFSWMIFFNLKGDTNKPSWGIRQHVVLSLAWFCG